MTDTELENKVDDFVNENHKNGYSVFALLAKDGKAQIATDGTSADIVAGLISFINDNKLNDVFINLLILLRNGRKRNN